MAAVLGCALVVTACSGDSEPPSSSGAVEEPFVPVYDSSLAPAAAVMTLVPEDATVLVVTDYDQLRLQLGLAGLTGESSAQERETFARRAAREAVVFFPGLLLADDQQLRDDYGFSQDDVAWEARFGTPTGEGFVLGLRDGLDLDGVERAVSDGVGALDGARLDRSRLLVTSGTTDAPADSWAADPARVALVGPSAAATYVDTGCIPYDVAFDDTDADDLAPAPAAELRSLDELNAFSVSYGTELVTVRLGQVRNDVFDRARLPEILPRTDPEFALGYLDPVADPSGGRIGYQLGDPDVAESLARERRLPFAVCSA